MINFLLDNGADINYNEQLALIKCCQRNFPISVKVLINRGVTITSVPLYIASCENNIDVVKLLLDAGADCNEKVIIEENDEDDYYNSVMIAIEDESWELIELFRNVGIDYDLLSNEMIEKISNKKFVWETKPENIEFRQTEECIISRVKLSPDIEKLGCSKCLNCFSKQSLEEWLIKKNTHLYLLPQFVVMFFLQYNPSL